MILAMRQQRRFKDATWYPQFLEAKPLELFVNLEESNAAFRDAHPEFENENLGHRTYRGNIGLKKKQPVTPAEFRKAYPDFAQDMWWSYRADSPDPRLFPNVPPPELQWRETQRYLRGAWDEGLPLEPRDLMMALALVLDPREVNEGGDGKPLLANILQIDSESTYYKSVVWLNSQPWRARTCKVCKRRFIASWPSNEHCSQHCAAIALREYKRKFREDHATQYNRNRKKARAKPYAARKDVLTSASNRSRRAKR